MSFELVKRCPRLRQPAHAGTAPALWKGMHAERHGGGGVGVGVGVWRRFETACTISRACIIQLMCESIQNGFSRRIGGNRHRKGHCHSPRWPRKNQGSTAHQPREPQCISDWRVVKLLEQAIIAPVEEAHTLSQHSSAYRPQCKYLFPRTSRFVLCWGYSSHIFSFLRTTSSAVHSFVSKGMM